jgi:hypothetical protein
MMDRYNLGGVDARLRVAVRAFNQGASRTASARTFGWHQKGKAKKTRKHCLRP